MPERTQEKDYVLAWLLAAMSASGDAGLVFKGGTALRRCYFRGYRYLTETLATGNAGLVDTCRSRISHGVSLLDPGADARGPVVTRWNLRINVEIGG